MRILRYYLTVSVLGDYDTEKLDLHIREALKELMPDANRNELRIHLCTQEAFDKQQEDLRKEERKNEIEKQVKKIKARPKSKKRHLTAGHSAESK